MYISRAKIEQIKIIPMNHGKPELSDGFSAFHSPHSTSFFGFNSLILTLCYGKTAMFYGIFDIFPKTTS